MSITDQQILGEIQDSLVEPNNSGASWASGMWTAAEVLNYFNNRQDQFLKETGILISRSALATTPNVNRQPLPTDCMFVQRLSWQDSTGVWSEIPRGDSFEMDYALNAWPYTMEPKPRTYADAEVPSLQVQLAPAPSDAGVAWALYFALATALTGAGVNFTVPDEFVATIKWGVVADMLSKVGRAMDRGRAAWAQERWQEGIEAARMIILGWEQS